MGEFHEWKCGCPLYSCWVFEESRQTSSDVAFVTVGDAFEDEEVSFRSLLGEDVPDVFDELDIGDVVMLEPGVKDFEAGFDVVVFVVIGEFVPVEMDFESAIHCEGLLEDAVKLWMD